MSDGLREFAKKHNRSIDDPRLRRLYELERRAPGDEAVAAQTEMQSAAAMQRMLFVRNMLRNKLPLELIYDCVDAPRAEIDAIISGLRENRKD